MKAEEHIYKGEIPGFLTPRLGRFTPSRFTYSQPIRVGLTGNRLLLTSPEDVYHTLVANSSNYTKTLELTGNRSRQRVGGGLLGRESSSHHERRRALQPLYSQRNAQGYAVTIEDQCKRFISHWRIGQTRDLAQEMGRLTRRILYASLFGDLSDRQVDSLEMAIKWRREHTERVYFMPLPNYDNWPTLSRWRDRKAKAVFADCVRQVLKNPTADKAGSSMLDRMTEIGLSNGQGFTESDIIDEVITMMSTAHETITEWLSWCWVLLARNPEFEHRWRLEIQGLGPWADWIGNPSESAPLTYGLLEESLRLYPPTWIFSRVPIKDDRLPSGSIVRAGQNLLLCQYLMHRHPNAFPDPERFNPTRFKTPNWAQQAGRTFFPFGAGAHRCIGEKFARIETLIVLLTIAREYSFERMERSPVIPHAGLTLGIRNGFPVRINRTT
jgi:cytochrome P450